MYSPGAGLSLGHRSRLQVQSKRTSGG